MLLGQSHDYHFEMPLTIQSKRTWFNRSSADDLGSNFTSNGTSSRVILHTDVDFGIHQILDEMIDGAPITVDAHVTHSNLLSLLKTD